MNQKLYKLMNWPDIEEITYAESSDPHKLLGPHTAGAGTLVQCFFPNAKKVTLQLTDSEKEYKMDLADEEGFYAVFVNSKKIGSYTYLVETTDGDMVTVIDPYQFAPQFNSKELEALQKGTCSDIYKKMGAHPAKINGISGIYFAVWAPDAMRVSVTGSFNKFDGRVHQMRKITDSGIYELFIPGLETDTDYQFEIKTKKAQLLKKADPFAVARDIADPSISKVMNLNGFRWQDQSYQEKQTVFKLDAPMNVFRIDLPNFVSKEKDSCNLRTLADQILTVLKDAKFTHVQLPVITESDHAAQNEHVTGLYAINSKYGTIKDLLYFVNTLHKVNIGVLLEMDLSSFSKISWGMAGFDGSAAYEHADARQGFSEALDAMLYNYGRSEVANYIKGSLHYYAEFAHIDGFVIKDMAPMLYLDYGKDDGRWVANIYGGNENLDAVELLKSLNIQMHKQKPGIIMISECNSLWTGITTPVADSGLGFDLRYNDGWYSGVKEYMDAYYKQDKAAKLLDDFSYQYSEQFILPITKDAGTSITSIIRGSQEQQDALLKMMYVMQLMHSGKKLLQIDQPSDLIFLTELMNIYHANAELFQLDTSEQGMNWYRAIAGAEGLISFGRNTQTGSSLYTIFNLSAETRNARFGIPADGTYNILINTDDICYNGKGINADAAFFSDDIACDGQNFSIAVEMAPYSAMILSYKPYDSNDLSVIETKCKHLQDKMEQADKLAMQSAESATKAENAAERANKLAQDALKKANALIEEAKSLQENAREIREKAQKDQAYASYKKQQTEALQQKLKTVREIIGK